MPLYRLCFQERGAHRVEQQVGFFNDEGALAYARRFARGRAVEVWRDAVLLHRDPAPRVLAESL
ncbi:hypothetical protein [Sphingosinicella sp. BN140058]|uniref:hypothetical protein n=1 Tax=Sphingosinicella sp. BN140058 TaxID=1892855 RepID=UPI001011C7BE|nr:hypothetical protein [Sphingosinicella sp. BN140058]QAY75745.1 hypothetical protein ETR14_03780 [Sphingosinicella sp. BN140058]